MEEDKNCLKMAMLSVWAGAGPILGCSWLVADADDRMIQMSPATPLSVRLRCHHFIVAVSQSTINNQLITRGRGLKRAEQQAFVSSQLEALCCPNKPVNLSCNGDGNDRDVGGG